MIFDEMKSFTKMATVKSHAVQYTDFYHVIETSW